MCLKNKDEDLLEFIKDITQFMDISDEASKNDKKGKKQEENEVRVINPNKRDPRTSLLLDVKPLNFILNPDNVIPWSIYKADYIFTKVKEKDDFFLRLMEDLEEFKETDDVRMMSRDKFKIVQNLQSSKLI